MVLNESQSLKDTFIIYVILMLEVPTIILFVVLWWTGKFGEDGYIPVLFFIGFLSLTTLFILNMSLQIRIDENGLQYKSFPFVNKWKFLPKESENWMACWNLEALVPNFPKAQRLISFPLNM